MLNKLHYEGDYNKASKNLLKQMFKELRNKAKITAKNNNLILNKKPISSNPLTELWIIRYKDSNSSYSYNTKKGYNKGLQYHKEYIEARKMQNRQNNFLLPEFDIYYCSDKQPITYIGSYK